MYHRCCQFPNECFIYKISLDFVCAPKIVMNMSTPRQRKDNDGVSNEAKPNRIEKKCHKDEGFYLWLCEYLTRSTSIMAAASNHAKINASFGTTPDEWLCDTPHHTTRTWFSMYIENAVNNAATKISFTIMMIIYCS